MGGTTSANSAAETEGGRGVLETMAFLILCVVLVLNPRDCAMNQLSACLGNLESTGQFLCAAVKPNGNKNISCVDEVRGLYS